MTDQIERKVTDKEQFTALAFKIMTDPFVGKLTYFRVYSGTLKSGSYVYNSVTDKKERISRILRMHANTREDVEEAYAGDIVAAVGLKHTRTGDTLCDGRRSDHSGEDDLPGSGHPRGDRAEDEGGPGEDGRSAARSWPKRIRRCASRRTKRPVRRSSAAWASCISRSSSTGCSANSRSKRTSASRRSPTRRRSARRCRRKGSSSASRGGRGQFGHVWIELEPNEKGKGFEFENGIVGGVIPKEYIKPVEQGIVEAMRNGVLAGYPVEDVKVKLFDGSFHEVDSSEMAFKIAGSMAFKEAARKADPVILEPIMAVEVVTPEEYMGDVMGDLNSRRGKIEGMTPAQGCAGDQGDGSAVGDVRVFDDAPLDDPGSRDLHDGALALR